MTFHGKNLRLTAGGLDYGLVFGGSQTTLQGRVRNIRRAQDISGVYAAAAWALRSAPACAASC